MIKSKFAITLHIMTLLAESKEEWYSSSYIAGSLNVNPVLVRNELAALKNKNFIESKEGKNGGVRLAISPSSIKLSDIFLLAKGEDHVLGYCKNTPNPLCQVGKKINENLEELFLDVDRSIELELMKTTLEDFRKRF